MGGPIYAKIYGPLTLVKTKWSDHGTQSRNKNAKEKDKDKDKGQEENGYEEKVLVTKMNCWFCKAELIWGCDYSYDDYGLEGDGIIATFSCPQCNSYVEAYSPEQTDE